MGTKTYELRVNQLDALQLDGDIFNILKSILTKSLSEISPRTLIRFQPELDLLINTAIWRYSIQKAGSSFGQDMLHLKFDPSQLNSTKLVLHFVLTIAAKYLSDNVTQRFTNSTLLQKISTIFENTFNLLNLWNFFRFLKTGHMPTLVDLALRLNYIPATENQKRNIGFYYMTRELFWEGFIELVGITLPLINYHAMKRRLNSFVSNARPAMMSQFAESGITVTRSSLCTFCNDRPTLPSHFGCGHIFCYYCLNSNLLADTEFECPKCFLNGSINQQRILS